MTPQNRKQFLRNFSIATAAAFTAPLRTRAASAPSAKPDSAVPSYLRGYETLYRENPRAAAVEWHRNAKWGMFIHYALESLRGLTAAGVAAKKAEPGDEWKKFKAGGEVDYRALRDRFTAEKFDADFITDLALSAEMRYINFTTRHRGDLYLFRTRVSDFTSLNSPAKRDLVAELAVQCEKKGLGLFM